MKIEFLFANLNRGQSNPGARAVRRGRNDQHGASVTPKELNNSTAQLRRERENKADKKRREDPLGSVLVCHGIGVSDR
ncbi:hypothetical protein AMELA_G00248600 [Ameiurus melas]|uniref:Uncharacterized protein n=1 Tax=Ameiurus melas TaxID=219545 RepID=A0A7J5ZVW5_AMEME|nr:hypothetical protein AMELA_G00248600 [Ameiurus melas]